MLEVLEVGYRAFGGGTLPAHLCEGQITKARWSGIVFYVRENLDGGWSFYISSNERMSDKGSNCGTGRPALRRNVLDLCTPQAIHRALGGSGAGQVPARSVEVRFLNPRRNPYAPSI